MIKLQTEAVQSDDKSGFGKGGWKRYQNLCHVHYLIILPPSIVVNCCVSFLILFVGFLSRFSKKVSKQGGLSNKHELSPVI